MTPADIERVFGRSRLQIATGRHVEVFREEARAGEERRYTKRFLADRRTATSGPGPSASGASSSASAACGDAGARRSLDFFPADESGDGAPADPRCRRDRRPVGDAGAAAARRAGRCATSSTIAPTGGRWRASAWSRSTPLHALGFVHLDLKPDNVCIPWAPAGAGRPGRGQPLAPRFKALALIDVAFSLVPEVDLPGPLPLLRASPTTSTSRRACSTRSRRAGAASLAATRALDWRCDFFSLAAMLWRYLPEVDDAPGSGWTSERHAAARSSSSSCSTSTTRRRRSSGRTGS